VQIHQETTARRIFRRAMIDGAHASSGWIPVFTVFVWNSAQPKDLSEDGVLDFVVEEALAADVERGE